MDDGIHETRLEGRSRNQRANGIRFQRLHIREETQEIVGQNLKALPKSPHDRYVGDIRLREIAGFDVAFTLGLNHGNWTILIIAVEEPGELENVLVTLSRAAATQFDPGALELLKGRKRRD